MVFQALFRVSRNACSILCHSQADPNGISPGVVSAEKLGIHEVGTERQDGECDSSKVNTTFIDWYKLGSSSKC